MHETEAEALRRANEQAELKDAIVAALDSRRKGIWAAYPFRQNRRFKAAEAAFKRVCDAGGWRDARGRWRRPPAPPELRVLGAY